MRRKGKEKPPSVEHTLCRLMNLGRQGQGQWQSWSRFNKTRVQFPKLSISFKFPKKSSLSKHYEWETIAFEFDCSRWKDVHTRTHIFRPFLSSSNPLHILSLSARFLLHMIVSFPFFPSPIPSLVVSIHFPFLSFPFFTNAETSWYPRASWCIACVRAPLQHPRFRWQNLWRCLYRRACS